MPMGLFTDFDDVVRRNEPLAPHVWLKMGGAAEYFAEPTSIDGLAALVRRCREENVPVRVLGGGSNVLVRDEGVPGMVVHLSAAAFGEISVHRSTVTAGGGANLGHVITASIRSRLAGLEQVVGIPGTLGGALHGNAASHGGDVGQWVSAATVMTRSGEILTRGQDDMQFTYRQSSLDELVILNAQFELEEEDPDELTRRMQKLWIVKKSKQPAADQRAGCIFKDQHGMSAASLIEQAGVKGMRVGNAEVADRYPNFIVAGPGASSQDVLRLIDLMRERVEDRLGIELETEINVW